MKFLKQGFLLGVILVAGGITYACNLEEGESIEGLMVQKMLDETVNEERHNMGRYECKRGRMNYLDKGEGKVLLFGHSFLWDSHMWDAQIEEFSKEYRCIVPDLWGHGKSVASSDEGFSMEELADDYIDLMNHLGIDKFTVVGLSVGGMWGGVMALKYPERIEGLVLSDTDLGSEPEETRVQYFGMMDAAVDNGGFPKPVINSVVPLFYSKRTLEEKADLVEYLTNFMESYERIETVVEMGKAIFTRKDVLEELKNLEIPAMVVVGSEDMPRPYWEAKRMADLIKGSTLAIIPDSGHVPNVEMPEIFNARLRTFLKQVYEPLSAD